MCQHSGATPRQVTARVVTDLIRSTDAAISKAEQAGGKVINVVDHPSRRAVSVADMDGIVMQLYVNRDWRPEVIATASPLDLPYLV
ncbi:hypothetical protein [Cupriavidus pauculus]|uniref:hypothetical protein n=1 Tax=Cupriavidus pauculus TaxID=82633 RepID=UPI0030FCC23D